MTRNNGRRFFCTLALTLLVGCSTDPYRPATVTPVNTPGSPPQAAPGTGATPPATTHVRITQPSIFVSQYSQDPTSVLVFAGTASGPTAPYLQIPGWHPAVDGAGNLYIVNCYFGAPYSCSPNIDVYSPDAVLPGTPQRSLHTHIASIYDMTVSRSGEIFISDGNGVAVFAKDATGDDPPSRYIQWAPSSYIAVDSSDNLYVLRRGTVAVFGPTATGAATPSRLIGGPHTRIRGEYDHDYGGLAVDAQGSVYVLCITEPAVEGLNSFGVLVFAADADGDAEPLRYVTTPQMNIEYDGTGVAVDTAGIIYVSASLDLNVVAVFEFPADASGSVTPSTVISSGAWGENAGGIALY